MGFAGNLSTLSLPEVVQTLARIQATGVLRIAADAGHREVVFDKGAMIGVEFADGAERQALLQRLIMLGRIDATAAASISATGSESVVVQGLTAEGLVGVDEVVQARREQAEEELISLCTWTQADFAFIDAGPDQPEVSALIQRWTAFRLSINTGSLLMEAARRMDEWERIRSRVPPMETVYGIVDGQDEALARAGEQFPAMAVTPLIDAIRTVEDIIRDAVVSRLEVCQVLVQLAEENLICPLNSEDLVAHGDYWKEQRDDLLAARLYRRALALQPMDAATRAKLGGCLESLGDSDEAAQCYAQLAIGCIDEGDPKRASEFAAYAVSLLPADPRVRLVLIRCLVSAGDIEGAINGLRELLHIYIEVGQLEDARGTCLKILELAPGDEQARRDLARIFSDVEGDQQSEDMVACVSCGTVNQREAETCSSCNSSLRLSCLSCGRTVAVSDRLCIFCGADPHAGDNRRRGGGRAVTSKYVRKSGQRGPASGMAAAISEAVGTRPVTEVPDVPTDPKGGTSTGGSSIQKWREDTARLHALAQEHEAAGHFEEALDAWRQLSRITSNNAQILTRIKELQVLVNQAEIEHQIDLGHRCARTRHPWQAAKAYRTALRLMGTDDPRVGPVSDLLNRSEKDKRKIGLIYGLAIVAIASCGAMALRPYFQIARFDREAKEVEGRISGVTAFPAPAQPGELREIDGEIERLNGYAVRISGAYGRKATREIGELRGALQSVRLQLAMASLRDISKAMAAHNAGDAGRLLDAHEAAFGNEFDPGQVAQLRERLNQLRKSLKQQDAERVAAPERFEAARAHEGENRLGSALAIYRDLSSSPVAEIATQAQAAIARLAPKEQLFLDEWAKVLALQSRDLVRAEQGLNGLADQAKLWNREPALTAMRNDIQSRLAAATVAYDALPAGDLNPAVLEAFLSTHGAAPQAAQVRGRLNVLQGRLRGRDQQYAQFQKQVAARQYQEAWESARDLVTAYGPLLPADSITIPLVVESQPTGATVLVDGKSVGKTPAVIPWHPGLAGKPPQDGEVVVSAPGWKPQSQRLARMSGQWKTQVVLERVPAWQFSLGKPVVAAHRLGEGQVLLLAGDALAAVDPGGTIRWRHALGVDEFTGGHARLTLPPMPLPGGRIAVCVPGAGVSIIDGKGIAVARIPVQGEVRGRPLVYTNDVMGADLRLAVAGESIFSGPVGGDMGRIPLPDLAVSGPVAFERDLDQVLVVGTASGRLVGMLEQGRRKLWDMDLQASDIGQLQVMADGLLIALLDGNRIAAIQVRSEGATIAWTHPLKAAAIGEPVVGGTTLMIAAGQSVLRYGLDGTTLPALSLPSPVSSPVSCLGDIAAVGTQDGNLVVFGGEGVLWTTPCSKPVTSVVVLADRVVAGLQDGTVVAFPR